MADRSFPDERAEIAPLLVVSELQRSLQFYVERLGAAVLKAWESYAVLRLGAGREYIW